jgi:hypothetical protein
MLLIFIGAPQLLQFGGKTGIIGMGSPATDRCAGGGCVATIGVCWGSDVGLERSTCSPSSMATPSIIRLKTENACHRLFFGPAFITHACLPTRNTWSPHNLPIVFAFSSILISPSTIMRKLNLIPDSMIAWITWLPSSVLNVHVLLPTLGIVDLAGCSSKTQGHTIIGRGWGESPIGPFGFSSGCFIKRVCLSYNGS